MQRGFNRENGPASGEFSLKTARGPVMAARCSLGETEARNSSEVSLLQVPPGRDFGQGSVLSVTAKGQGQQGGTDRRGEHAGMGKAGMST